MSINVNSAETNALLRLFPMAIPGAEQKVFPPGVYHLGIPLSLHSPTTALFMVIDPVTTLATTLQANDSVRLWVNGLATSVIKIIKPGEENDPIDMELPWGGLVDGGNTLFYRVTRPSGNFDDSTPVLNVLFNNPASGITASHPASVAPGQPATFTLTRNYPREYDVVTLTVGRWSKTIPYAHPANPISYTLSSADLQQIGDGTHPVSATVVDQLSNSNVSPTTSIVINANQRVLNPPIIVEAEPGKTLDVVALKGRDSTIHGQSWTAIASGQQVWLKLTGRNRAGVAVTLQIWNGGASRVNATWVSQGFWPKPLPASFLSQLADGSGLLMEFWVSEDKSGNFATATKFPDQVYTVRAIAPVAPTITSVKADSATGPEVPDGASTTATTFVLTGKGTASQTIVLRDNGAVTASINVGATGDWSHTLSGQELCDHAFTVEPADASFPASQARTLSRVHATDFQDDSYNGWVPFIGARSGFIRVHSGVKAFFNFTDINPATGYAGAVFYQDFILSPGTYILSMKATHVPDSPAPNLVNPLLSISTSLPNGPQVAYELPKNGVWYDFSMPFTVPVRQLIRLYIVNHQDYGIGNDFGIRGIGLKKQGASLSGVMESLNTLPPYTGLLPKVVLP